MAGLKYYERTKYLIELIEKQKTGSPDELARRIGVSKRTVYRILEDLKFFHPKKIIYNHEKKSYIFS
ncbi:HTH domain-containing protein [Fulvivirgaceae bacterium LMO-SS25]